MTQPTQQLPPWLSFSTTTITGANGSPIATSTTLQYLPLTYYGPSIPLGSLYTFGGSTSPASTSSHPTTTSIPTSSLSSAIPTTITPSSSAIPSSFSSTPPISNTISSSSILPSSSSAASSGDALSRGQVVGIIVASVLGLIGIFGLCILILLWRAGKRRRNRDILQPRFKMVNALDEDWYHVGSGGNSPGEGSPRHSGEEADPFLERNRDAHREMKMTDNAPLLAGAAAGSSSARPPDNSLSSSEKTNSSAASGYYGTLLDRPTVGVRTTPPERRGGKILSPDELRRLDEESVLPNTDFGPTMPPRLPRTPPAGAGAHPFFADRNSGASMSPSLQADAGENPTVMAARRVRVEDLPSPLSASPSSSSPLPSSSKRASWRDAGLAGLANIARMSWFRNPEGSSKGTPYTGLQTSELSDRDIEVGRTGLTAPSSFRPGPRRTRSNNLPVGYGTEGSRPISTVSGKSARSGNSGPSIYHDAHSSLPGTPTPGLTPLPRAVTPANQAEIGVWDRRAEQHHQQDTHHSNQSEPPSYDDPPPLSHSSDLPPDVDVLDFPAPRGHSPYASLNSLRETTTNSSIGSSTGIKLMPFPPGLIQPAKVRPWGAYMSTTGSIPSTANIDILEEEPPIPASDWTSIAVAVGNRDVEHIETGKRTTFGMPRIAQSPDFVSEQGSLHSMRSHLSPGSNRSAGSAPASRRDGSGSTNSNRSGPSLGHSNSISSDDRRRRNMSPRSPAYSAFGSRSPTGASFPPMSHDAGRLFPSESSTNSSGESGAAAATRAVAVRSDQDVVYGPSEEARPSSPLLASAPWAGGLDEAWTPR